MTTQDRSAYAAALQLIEAGVWTVDPAAGTIRNAKDRMLGSLSDKGYRRTNVKVGGLWRFVYVHRVIWESQHGPIPAGLEIDHGNGRKDDNRLSNLDVVTGRENKQRARALGLVNDYGADSANAKLTPQLVEHLRRVGAAGLAYGSVTQRDLTNWYRVSQATISRVLNGRRYSR